MPEATERPAGLFPTAEEKHAMAEQERLVGAGARTHGTFDGGTEGTRR